MNKSQEQVFQEYTIKKKRLNMFFFIFVPALIGILALMGSPWGKEHVIACVVILFLLIIPGAIVSNMIWTCPACRKMLRKNWRPKFCPQCGVPLEPTKEAGETPTTT